MFHTGLVPSVSFDAFEVYHRVHTRAREAMAAVKKFIVSRRKRMQSFIAPEERVSVRKFISDTVIRFERYILRSSYFAVIIGHSSDFTCLWGLRCS